MALRRQVLKFHSFLPLGEAALTTEAFASCRHSFSSQFNTTKTSLTRAWYSSQTPISESTHLRQNKSIASRLRGLLRDYKQLSKARLSALVVATSAAGYAAGSKERIDWKGMGWTSLGTMLTASSANALNQIYEVINDGKMKRTALRPLPTGRMSRWHALAFAIATGGSGVWLLNEKTNALAAGLAGGNILLYAGIYTPIKQLSVINTWVGAVVGAVPPLLGWAAAAGELDTGAAILAAGLYFWQMPHFMALAWLCRNDYSAGGYRMLSLIDATGKRTAACALRNCAYLLPLGILGAWLGVTTPYFAYESSFITAGMLLTAAKFYSSPTNTNARLLFRASLLHLPLFMLAFLLHRKPNLGQDRGELLSHNLDLLGFGRKVMNEQELLDYYLNKNMNSNNTRSTSITQSGTSTSQKGAPSTAVSHADDDDSSYLNGSGDKVFEHTMTRISIPPLPFLPAPHRIESILACPSKAMCDEVKDRSSSTSSTRDKEGEKK